MPQPPSDAAPIADDSGRVTQPWRAFFAKLAGAAGASQPIAADASPFVFTAPSGGSLVIQGAVTGLTLIRGRAPVALDPGLRMIPLAAGDSLSIGYTAAPGLVFLPA